MQAIMKISVCYMFYFQVGLLLLLLGYLNTTSGQFWYKNIYKFFTSYVYSSIANRTAQNIVMYLVSGNTISIPPDIDVDVELTYDDDQQKESATR